MSACGYALHSEFPLHSDYAEFTVIEKSTNSFTLLVLFLTNNLLGTLSVEEEYTDNETAERCAVVLADVWEIKKSTEFSFYNFVIKHDQCRKLNRILSHCHFAF